MYHKWTASEIKFIIENRGVLSVREMADELGLTPSMVSSRLCKFARFHNLPKLTHKYTQEEDDTIVEMWDSGLTRKENIHRISKVMPHTEFSISAHIRQRNMQLVCKQPDEFVPDVDIEALAEYAKTHSYYKVAKKFGLSYHNANIYARKYGGVNKTTTWTTDEEDIIKHNYNKDIPLHTNAKKLTSVLPGKKWTHIVYHIKKYMTVI